MARLRLFLGCAADARLWSHASAHWQRRAPREPTASLSTRVWLTKAGILFTLHQIDDALFAIDQSLALTPNYVFAWAQKAYILQRSGNSGYQEQALAAACKALYESNNQLIGAWRVMALIAQAGAENALGNCEKALATAREAQRHASDSSTIYLVQADALAHLVRQTESLAAAQQGLANVERQLDDDPERIECWENKSALLRCLGRWSEAEGAETQLYALQARMHSASGTDAP
jgi:tetratricopeptide (TPR) repeat protein